MLSSSAFLSRQPWMASATCFLTSFFFIHAQSVVVSRWSLADGGELESHCKRASAYPLQSVRRESASLISSRRRLPVGAALPWWRQRDLSACRFSAAVSSWWCRGSGTCELSPCVELERVGLET